MDAVGAVGARRKYREAPTPNEAGGGTCMLRRAIIPLTCMFNCRVYRPQPLRQPAVLLDAELPVLGSVHATEYVHDLLVVARLLLVFRDLHGVRDDEHAARREDLVAERLRVREGDRVVDELDGLAARELRDLRCERGCGQGTVEDVGRAEGLEERFVVRGRGGDDGRELGELRYLDGCIGIRIQ